MDNINLTVFKDRGGFELAEYKMRWSELVAWIKNPPVAASKDALPLIKLATFGKERSARGSLRHDKNVKIVWGIEADYDRGEMAPERAVELLRARDIQSIVYTTPTHTREVPRWRVLAPYHCYGELPETRRENVEKLNGVLGGVLSAESFVLSQAFYFGRVEGIRYEAWDT